MPNEFNNSEVVRQNCPARGRIVEQWRWEPEAKRKDMAEKLVILSSLRDLEDVAKEEVRRMPITVDLKKAFGPWLEEERAISEARGIERGLERGIERGMEQGLERGMEKGMEAGELRALSSVLEHRFGPLPQWIQTRLEGASRGQVEAWIIRALDARNLEEVFRS